MDEKVALITGSSAGIGFAIAQSLARAGASVVINGRTRETAEKAAAEIESAGGRAFTAVGDAFDEKAIPTIVDAVIGRFGRLDILVNNAGAVGAGQRLEDMPVEVWDRTMNANLRSVFLFCKTAIPHLRRQGGGRIVCIGGLSGKNPLPFASADAASKAGLLGLTRSLAAELGSANITVNAVIPGLQADTALGAEFNARLAEAFHISPEDAVAGTKMRTLLKRFETLGEIGGTVAFLCSEAGGAITGQNLNVNCGLATY